MRKILLTLILVAIFGANTFAAERISPYLNGINITHKDRGRVFEIASAPAAPRNDREKVLPRNDELLRIFKVVRFPGGLLADKYHWAKGGTKEFVEFCDGIGAEKMITVNFKTGRVEEAANWVEFCNGAVPEKIPAEWKKIPFAYNHKAPEGYFAYARRALDREEPYKVRFWEIGNEIDWWNRIDAQGYAEEAVNYAKAMRAKDKDILIGACGSPLDDEWNKKVLQIAGKYIDFLIIHIYGGPDRKYEDRQEEYRVLFSKNRRVEERLKKIKELIKKYAPHCRIAITEGNTSYNEFKLGKDELRKLKSALWIARLRNTLIRQGVMAYCHWNLTDNDLYGVINRDGSVTPTYEVLRWYALYTGSEVLGGASLRLLRHFVPRNDGGSVLDYVGTIDTEKKKAYVMVVNVGAEAVEAEVDLSKLELGDFATIRTLHNADRLGLESQKAQIVERKSVVDDGKVKCVFLPASVTCVEIEIASALRASQ